MIPPLHQYIFLYLLINFLVMLYPSGRINSLDPREWDLLPGGPHNVRAQIAQSVLFTMFANLTSAGDTNSSHGQIQLPLGQKNITGPIIEWGKSKSLSITESVEDYFWQTWWKPTRDRVIDLHLDIAEFCEDNSWTLIIVGALLAVLCLWLVLDAYISAAWKSKLKAFLGLIMKYLGKCLIWIFISGAPFMDERKVAIPPVKHVDEMSTEEGFFEEFLCYCSEMCVDIMRCPNPTAFNQGASGPRKCRTVWIPADRSKWPTPPQAPASSVLKPRTARLPPRPVNRNPYAYHKTRVQRQIEAANSTGPREEDERDWYPHCFPQKPQQKQVMQTANPLSSPEPSSNEPQIKEAEKSKPTGVVEKLEDMLGKSDHNDTTTQTDKPTHVIQGAESAPVEVRKPKIKLNFKKPQDQKPLVETIMVKLEDMMKRLDLNDTTTPTGKPTPVVQRADSAPRNVQTPSKKEPNISKPPPIEPQKSADPRVRKPNKPQKEKESIAQKKQPGSPLKTNQSVAEPPKTSTPWDGKASPKETTTSSAADKQVIGKQPFKQPTTVSPFAVAPQTSSWSNPQGTVPSQVSPAYPQSSAIPSSINPSVDSASGKHIPGLFSDSSRKLPASSPSHTVSDGLGRMPQPQNPQGMNSNPHSFSPNTTTVFDNVRDHTSGPSSYSTPGHQQNSVGLNLIPQPSSVDVNMTSEPGAPTAPFQARIPPMAGSAQHVPVPFSPQGLNPQPLGSSAFSTYLQNRPSTPHSTQGYTTPSQFGPPASGRNNSASQPTAFTPPSSSITLGRATASIPSVPAPPGLNIQNVGLSTVPSFPQKSDAFFSPPSSGPGNRDQGAPFRNNMAVNPAGPPDINNSKPDVDMGDSSQPSSSNDNHVGQTRPDIANPNMPKTFGGVPGTQVQNNGSYPKELGPNDAKKLVKNDKQVIPNAPSASKVQPSVPVPSSGPGSSAVSPLQHTPPQQPPNQSAPAFSIPGLTLWQQQPKNSPRVAADPAPATAYPKLHKDDIEATIKDLLAKTKLNDSDLSKSDDQPADNEGGSSDKLGEGEGYEDGDLESACSSDDEDEKPDQSTSNERIRQAPQQRLGNGNNSTHKNPLHELQGTKWWPREKYPDNVAGKLPIAAGKVYSIILKSAPDKRWGPIDELASIKAEIIPKKEIKFWLPEQLGTEFRKLPKNHFSDEKSNDDFFKFYDRPIATPRNSSTLFPIKSDRRGRDTASRDAPSGPSNGFHGSNNDGTSQLADVTPREDTPRSPDKAAEQLPVTKGPSDRQPTAPVNHTTNEGCRPPPSNPSKEPHDKDDEDMEDVSNPVGPATPSSSEQAGSGTPLGGSKTNAVQPGSGTVFQQTGPQLPISQPTSLPAAPMSHPVPAQNSSSKEVPNSAHKNMAPVPEPMAKATPNLSNRISVRNAKTGEIELRPIYPDDIAEFLAKSLVMAQDARTKAKVTKAQDDLTKNTAKARALLLNKSVKWDPTEELRLIREGLVPSHQVRFWRRNQIGTAVLDEMPKGYFSRNQMDNLKFIQAHADKHITPWTPPEEECDEWLPDHDAEMTDGQQPATKPSSGLSPGKTSDLAPAKPPMAQQPSLPQTGVPMDEYTRPSIIPSGPSASKIRNDYSTLFPKLVSQGPDRPKNLTKHSPPQGSPRPSDHGAANNRSTTRNPDDSSVPDFNRPMNTESNQTDPSRSVDDTTVDHDVAMTDSALPSASRPVIPQCKGFPPSRYNHLHPDSMVERSTGRKFPDWLYPDDIKPFIPHTSVKVRQKITKWDTKDWPYKWGVPDELHSLRTGVMAPSESVYWSPLAFCDNEFKKIDEHYFSKSETNDQFFHPQRIVDSAMSGTEGVTTSGETTDTSPDDKSKAASKMPSNNQTPDLPRVDPSSHMDLEPDTPTTVPTNSPGSSSTQVPTPTEHVASKGKVPNQPSTSSQPVKVPQTPFLFSPGATFSFDPLLIRGEHRLIDRRNTKQPQLGKTFGGEDKKPPKRTRDEDDDGDEERED